MEPFIRKVADAGHQVTVFETSSNEKKRDLGPNITLIHLHVPVDNSVVKQLGKSMFTHRFHGYQLGSLYKFGDDKFNEFIDTRSEVVAELFNEEWDLIVLDELFGVHSFALATFFKRRKNVPYIIQSTTSMLEGSAVNLALGRNWVSEPYGLSPTPKNRNDTYRSSSFRNRLINVYERAGDYFSYEFAGKVYMSSLKRFGLQHFTWTELFREASWVATDYLDHTKVALPKASDVRYIGSHCPQAKPLPADLEEFVNDPRSNGTIYVAFGSNVLWDCAPDWLQKAYFDAVNALDSYRVIFSYNGPLRPVKPHVKVTRWAPQVDILAHTRTLVFVSHGGLKSTKEALCTMTPTVVMPIYAEQGYNAKLALRMGYTMPISKFKTSAKQIVDAIKTVRIRCVVLQ
ncbi:UGT-63 protein [Aphelenchoides avenae]|nr:UGT-63 protein [Aphelenchus avenae]